MLPKKPAKTPPPYDKAAPAAAQAPAVVKKDSSAPTWGTKKDALAGLPMFRSPGGALLKGTLFERFRNLKSRDLAFIISGLAVLIMAPMAEYLVSSPEDKAGTMPPGFNERGPIFNEGSSPYEEGIYGIAQGGLPGQDSDVITPLNVRDPTSMIMSPGGTPKPPAEAAPAPPPPKPEPGGWKDAIAAAKRGTQDAVRKAPGLPKPSGKLNNMLKDWQSTVSGASRGGGPSFKLDAPSTKGLFSEPKARKSYGSIPGLRGGSRVLAAGTGGGAGGGGRYGGPGGYGGGSALDIFGGGVGGGGQGSGGGAPGAGPDEKNPGGGGEKGTRNITIGESLEFLRKKLNMEKAIDLKWAKRRYNELERKKMLEQMAAQTAQQALLKILDKLLEGKKDGGKDGGGGGGSPGGGSPGGEKPPGGERERGAASLPSTIVRPLPRTEAPAKAEDAVTGQEEAVRLTKQALGQLKGLSSKPLKDIQEQIDVSGAPEGDPARAIHAALGSAISAVEGAATDLGNGMKDQDKRLQRIADVNKEISPNLKKVETGANAEEQVTKLARAILDKPADRATQEPKLKAQLELVKKFEDKPIATEIAEGEVRRISVEERQKALSGAQAAIEKAYAAIAQSKLAAQIPPDLKDVAVLAVQTSNSNVGEAGSALNAMYEGLSQGERLTGQAKEAYNAADGQVGTEHKDIFVRAGEEVLTASRTADASVKSAEGILPAIKPAVAAARKKFGSDEKSSPSAPPRVQESEAIFIRGVKPPR